MSQNKFQTNGSSCRLPPHQDSKVEERTSRQEEIDLNVVEVVSKAKRAASSLWMVLHAQVRKHY